MAYASEAMPMARQPFPVFWGTFGDLDMTQWRWQPPKTPSPKAANDPAPLPKWLVEWDQVVHNGPSEPEHLPSLQNQSFLNGSNMAIEINKFLESILVAPSNVDGICNEFNRHIKQALSLGMVSEESLQVLLSSTTDILRTNFELSAANLRCTAFYLAVWQGIASSKVVRPRDLDGHVIAAFISLISQLPSTTEVQHICRELLTSVSDVQLETMTQSIILLVKAWIPTWLKDDYLANYDPSLRDLEASVLESGYNLQRLQDVVASMSAEPYSETEIAGIRASITKSKMEMSSRIGKIADAELLLSSVKTSVKTLVDTLWNVPQPLIAPIIQACSEHILDEYPSTDMNDRRSFQKIRYCWLSFIARSRFADDELFVKEWHRMESASAAMGRHTKSATINRLTNTESSDLVMYRWISQGLLSSASAVENTFSAYGPDRSFALLLKTIDMHRENFWSRTKDLVNLLHKLGRHRSVHRLFAQMVDLDLKIPASLMASVIETMSSSNPRLALGMFKMYHRIRYDNKPLRADGCPNLILSLINDPTINPKEIWSILGIPMLEGPKHLRRISPSKPLSKSRVDLLHKMALAFARSECRSQRVALRNVMHCATYLRIHNAVALPELSKAISYAGITREIIRKHWIGSERLRWALSVISWIEGEEVARTVNQAAQLWRERMTQEQVSHRRDCNVLNVGPID